jgi:hypothetical protein
VPDSWRVSSMMHRRQFGPVEQGPVDGAVRALAARQHHGLRDQHQLRPALGTSGGRRSLRRQDGAEAEQGQGDSFHEHWILRNVR